MFERVEWNEQTESHEPIQSQDPLPIAPDMWPKTRVQAVGHGNINSGTATIAGFSAEVFKNALVLFVTPDKCIGCNDRDG